MSEWKEYKLGDLITLNYGKALKEENRIAGTIPVYSSAGITGYHTSALVNSKGIIVGRKGTIGKVYLSNIPFNCIDTAYYILPKEEKYNFKFLYYLLQTLGLEDLNSDSAVPGLNRDAAYSQEIILPSIKEQTCIALILTSLDDKIDLLQRQNKTLEQLAEILFRQWFVEEVAESWEEISIGDLIEIRGGYAYKGEYIGQGDSLLLGMGCVSFGERFLKSGARSYSGDCPQKYFVKPGDLVIATRQQSDNLPILGFPAIIPQEFEGKDVIVGANLYKMINKSEIDNYLFYLLFRSSAYRNHILASSKGSTVRMITKDAIESFVIKMPPEKIIKELQIFMTPIREKLDKISIQINTLTQLRDTLLPKLMSGEVRV